MLKSLCSSTDEGFALNLPRLYAGRLESRESFREVQDGSRDQFKMHADKDFGDARVGVDVQGVVQGVVRGETSADYLSRRNQTPTLLCLMILAEVPSVSES